MKVRVYFNTENITTTDENGNEAPVTGEILYTSVPDSYLPAVYVDDYGLDAYDYIMPEVIAGAAAMLFLGPPNPDSDDIMWTPLLTPFVVGTLNQTTLVSTGSITLQELLGALATGNLGDLMPSPLLQLADGQEVWPLKPDFRSFYPVGYATTDGQTTVGPIVVKEPHKVYEFEAPHEYTVLAIGIIKAPEGGYYNYYY